MSLSGAEIAVLLALYVLGNRGTAKRIAEITKMDAQVVRNTLRKLRMKELVRTHKATAGRALLLPVLASVAQEEAPEGREVVYELARDIDTIFKEHKDSILKWARELGIGSIEELRRLLEQRREEVQSRGEGTE